MYLFKFRALDSYESIRRALDILRNQQLFLSEWDKLNDPADADCDTALPANNEEIAEEERQLYAEVQIRKQQTKVCCFSRTYANSILWSYYANGFKGLCFIVEVDDKLVTKVNYSKHTRIVKKGIHPEELDSILSEKRSQWSHEFEARVITDAEKDYLQFKPIGVIAGHLLSQQFRDRISNRCKSANIGYGETELQKHSAHCSCTKVAYNVRLNKQATAGLPNCITDEWNWSLDYAPYSPGIDFRCQCGKKAPKEHEHSFFEKHVKDTNRIGNGFGLPNNVEWLCPNCHKLKHLGLEN